MNSGLSCLSQTKLLTNYFLSNKYKTELNYDNALATKECDLAKKYGYLLKYLHMGTENCYAPHKFKKAIGKKNHIFQDFG